MKRRKALVGILSSMLVLSACSFSNTNEYDTEVVSDNEVCDEEAIDYMKGNEYWESLAKND